MIQYRTLNCNGQLVSLERPAVIGIVNVTPDSFHSSSRVTNLASILQRVEEMQSEGALVIDIGAMSSRPGAAILSPEEEWSRMDTVVQEVRKQFPKLLLSIDTIHSTTAGKVLDLGVDIINDISGGTYDPAMIQVVGRYDVPFVVMHMKGQPQDMQNNPEYDNVVAEVFDFFVERIAEAEKYGIVDIVLDPGFGFGKTLQHNYELLHELHAFEILRYPVLAGVSRKGMIKKTLDVDTENALNGTTAVHMLALMKGARLLRVHDVKEAVECIKIWEKFMNPGVELSRSESYIVE